jgi:hypothetical protein
MNLKQTIYFLLMGSLVVSCASAPKHFPVKYYKENEKTLMRMESTYNRLYRTKPIAAEFLDNDFRYVTVEMKTDSLRYIYEFDLSDKKLNDTLLKYGYDTTSVMRLIRDMQKIKCTWINNLDYYVDGAKQNLVYMSIRPKALDIPFARKKYYTLTFYKQPQYYDAEGRLLDRRNRRRLRRINNEIFRRINDRVCYTLSAKFR